MSTDLAVTWILALAPLSVSPGPANILFAASGGAFGTKATMPFLIGTNLVCILQSIAVGLGLGVLIANYQSSVYAIKYLGVIFLLYLAYKFFRMVVSTKEIIRPLGFKDGVIVEALNVKYLMIPMIMFSQFYSSGEPSCMQIFGLTFALAILTLMSNLAWVIGGNVFTAFISKQSVQKVQGATFGVLLCVTAIWLAVG